MKKKINISRRNATIFKQFFIIAMVVMTVADLLFLAIPKYSTISKIVLYSSPQYMVFIWLFGMMTTNFFFPRKKSIIKIKKSTSIVVSVCIAIILLFVGHAIVEEKNCASADFPSFKKGVPYYMEVTCREYEENIRVDCNTLKCKQQAQAYILKDGSDKTHQLRYDLRLEMKLILMIFGFISGYFIWSQSIEENIT